MPDWRRLVRERLPPLALGTGLLFALAPASKA
jgi:hypothetical protein